MIKVQSFTFNPFQENTIILHDESNECIIIDPGMDSKQEEDLLTSYIDENRLKPVLLVNTHAHVDHILGNTRTIVISIAGSEDRKSITPNHILLFLEQFDQILQNRKALGSGDNSQPLFL